MCDKVMAEALESALKVLADDRKRREEEIAAERRMGVEERSIREQEWITERRRLQGERDAREEEMQRRMEILVRLVERPRDEEGIGRGKPELSIKLVPLSEKDDIEAYLITFERIMVAHKVDKERWPHYLAPQLTGKAQLAFAALPTVDADDYEAIKNAILVRYDINEEAYRRRFRSTVRSDGETNRELAVKLMELQRKWQKGCTSKEDLQEIVGKEQFYKTLGNTEKKLRVMERSPKTCVEASR